MNTADQTKRTTTLSIDGMSCGHCVQAVTKALSAVPGVTIKSVEVGSAVIETADGWAAGRAVAALDQAGYPAKAVGDSAATTAAVPMKGGGGCCGGARSAAVDHGSTMPQGGGGAKGSGGCCG